MRKLLALFSFVAVLLLVQGCYTRFATFEPVAVAPGQVITYVDSAGKTVAVIKSVDTVGAAAKNEICVWERDLMGFPYLHCYPSYYPRQWYLYNYSPWWYNQDQHLSNNSDKCPSYYYYDPNCGCCRYYLNNPDLQHPLIGNDNRSSGNQATNTVPQPGDTNRISITTSSHSTIWSSRKGFQQQQSLPLVNLSKENRVGTVLDSAALRRRNDSALVNRLNSVDTTRRDTTSTVRDSSGQRRDSVVTTAPQKPRRSMRSR